MLAAAADEKFGALIVRDVDRLSRNDEEQPGIITRVAMRSKAARSHVAGGTVSGYRNVRTTAMYRER